MYLLRLHSKVSGKSTTCKSYNALRDPLNATKKIHVELSISRSKSWRRHTHSSCSLINSNALLSRLLDIVNQCKREDSCLPFVPNFFVFYGFHNDNNKYGFLVCGPSYALLNDGALTILQ